MTHEEYKNMAFAKNPALKAEYDALETDTHIDEDGNKVEIIYKKNCHIQTIRVLKGSTDCDYWECKDYDENGNLIKEYITHLPELPRIECTYVPPTPTPSKPPNPRPYKTPLDT